MSENNNQVGVIHEIGDLGLGFNPLTEQEQEKIRKQQSESDQK